MESDRLKREYESFLEYTHDLVTWLEELQSYAREISDKCDIKYVEKINYNLPFIEKYINILKEIHNEAKNLSFDIYDIQTEKFTNNIIVFPLYEDEDIYVDLNEPLPIKWRKDDD